MSMSVVSYTCEQCGSERLQVIVLGYCGSGVYHPDGTEEIHWVEVVRCRDCGFQEEI
jgi:hypothetical protein